MHVPSSDLRSAFSRAMSEMYRAEVPAYGRLVALVSEVNAASLAADPDLRASLAATEGLERLSEERHGAIRLGTAEELSTIARMFAVLGMEPVGYYDLSVAGIPVHSTAFRPVDADALAANPFRVFTSLLRLDRLPAPLRAEAEAALAARDIFSPEARRLLAVAETEGGLSAKDGAAFVAALLETFRWRAEAPVAAALHDRLAQAHRLVADVVSFAGPHINHLTPRTLDIDAAQAAMPVRGIAPKAVVEGPPRRACPILLRQTSFKALEEGVTFACGTPGRHTARFGEIETRGVALTSEGRALYDALLAEARAEVTPLPDGSNADAYVATLERVFAAFPDEWDAMRERGLAFFRYSVTDAGRTVAEAGGAEGSPERLIADGFMRADPIVYEDFLPVSAAGIFQSNLGDTAAGDARPAGAREAFEAALGRAVRDEIELYAAAQADSLRSARAMLSPTGERVP